jgi:hypothetical protein
MCLDFAVTGFNSVTKKAATACIKALYERLGPTANAHFGPLSEPQREELQKILGIHGD